MKKVTLFFAFAIGISTIKANVVSQATSQKVAQNFYAQTYPGTTVVLNLAYIEKDNNGTPVYYVFDASESKGFVIVSAENAGMPIIGYSDKGSYVQPVKGGNAAYWMAARKNEIIHIRANHVATTSKIAETWNDYINNIKVQTGGQTHRILSSFPSNSYYLVSSTWDQPSPYNGYCPGGSVTGCVATAMSQIMWYWQYPAHGIGYSSYNDSPPSFTSSYGILDADYDTSNYVWAEMPASVTGSNNEVAKLLYDAGVSVQMDYSPSESGAWVITADAISNFADSACAQRSFIKYFGYDAATIQGLYESNYTTGAWLSLLQNELDNNRPIEYVGTDPNNGGHTWVCDGYDASNNFHMNWGWSAADDGWYSLGNLNPSPYDFSQGHEALIGIEPPPIMALFSATPLTSCSAPATVTFTDRSLIPSPVHPITSWHWSFPGGTPSTSTLQNPTITYSTSGSYNVSLTVINNLDSSTITKSNYISVGGTGTLPMVQGFEGSFPPAAWSVDNNVSLLTTWQQIAGTGGFGTSSHCIMYDNCMHGQLGEYDKIITPKYNFTSVTNPKMYFDVAYAPYNATYSDTLAVYYSTDCGSSWTQVYLKGGMDLCTTGGKSVSGGANTQGGCFYPLSANWRTDTISIPAISGQPNVTFAFEDRSGNGSDMYLDNINLPNAIPLSISNLSETNSLAVYPNPNTGNFNIAFNAQQGKTYTINIYNVLGQCVVNKTVRPQSNNYILPVNMANCGKGLYSVVLKCGSSETTKSVINK